MIELFFLAVIQVEVVRGLLEVDDFSKRGSILGGLPKLHPRYLRWLQVIDVYMFYIYIYTYTYILY